MATEQHWQVVANGQAGCGTTAKDLWEYSLIYFQWCDANPIHKPELIRAGERAGDVIQVPIPRPYTITGLCLHLNLTREYLYDVAKSKVKNEFYFVANKILEIIYTQKLEYAIAGVFSPVVASKELGLGNGITNDKSAPVINIEVQDGPKLLTDERDVEIPENRK